MTSTPGPAEDPRDTSQATWAAVDEYFNAGLSGEDEALAAARQASAAAGLPDIAVSAAEGKLLHLLARGVGAHRILEVGTLGGYSTIWLARAITRPGQLIALELSPHHAEVAAANLDRAGFGDLAEIRVGPAAGSLEALVTSGAEPFDFVFIDADKTGYPTYLTWAEEHLRPGGIVLLDNAFGWGGVADPAKEKESHRAAVQALADCAARLGAPGGHWQGTMIPTEEGLAFGVKVR